MQLLVVFGGIYMSKMKRVLCDKAQEMMVQKKRGFMEDLGQGYRRQFVTIF